MLINNKHWVFCHFILFLLFTTVGCTETNNTKATQEIPVVITDEFPSVRYVAAKDGLVIRDAPSRSSNRLGALLYGARVVVEERSEIAETINGITAHWYKSNGVNGVLGDGWFISDFWLFGGFLSPAMPEDVSPLLGRWDTDRGERDTRIFYPNNTGGFGWREAHTWWFDWTFVEDKLTLTWRPEEIFEGMSEERIITKITVTVIDRDRILFVFDDGSQEVLSRNNNAL